MNGRDRRALTRLVCADPSRGRTSARTTDERTRVGRWVLGDRLGGSTWQAVDERSGRPVALRLPGEPEVGSAVDAEAEALRWLRPLDLPGLVRLLGEAGGAVATELVDGPVLVDLEPMPWPAVAAVLAPVAEALAAIHDAGWVHGDVAATNVVVGPDGRGVLVDLGCAAPIGRARPTGTPGWVAPEVESANPVTPAADVWSLAAVAASAMGGPASRPPGAALALRRALAVEPADRPTAAELAAVLRVAAGAPPAVAGIAPPRDPHPAAPRHPRPAAPRDPRAATTRDFGPRPPAPPVPSPVPARRAGPGAVVATVAALAALAWWAGRPDPEPPLPAASPAGLRCPPLAPGAAIVGDPDGDGCDTTARWSDGVLVVTLRAGSPPARVAVGASGDVIVLGDWDCDGVDTPGAYRPTTGAVTLWGRWPTPGARIAPISTAVHQRGGEAVVEADPRTGCDRLRVTAAR